MTSTIPLAATYEQARDRFLAEARECGATVDSYLHPRAGLDGEELAIDVARLGPDDATDVVLVVSGTHGVEGFCGSALQSRWLECLRVGPTGSRSPWSACTASTPSASRGSDAPTRTTST